MAVNSYLICERLEDYIVKKLDRCTTERRIKYVTIYNPLIKINSNTAYIVVDKALFPTDKNDEKCLMIVLGRLDTSLLEETQHETICVNENFGLGRLYENLQQIIEYYNVWEEKLSAALLSNTTLDEICSLSVDYFGNPLTVQTGNFEIVGVGETEQIKYPYSFREGDSDYLADEWIKSALEHTDYVFKTRGPFQFNYIDSHPSLLYNIFSGKRYVAQICVDANSRPLVRCDFVRIAIFAEYVEKYVLKKFNSMSIAPLNRFREQLASAVTGNEKLENNKPLSVSMIKNNWKSDENYICAVVRVASEDTATALLDYFVRKWEPEIGNCISFNVKSSIFVLVNTYDAEGLSENQYTVFNNLAEEHSCYIGISNSFSDFYKCKSFFSQACAAVKAGSIKTKECRVFDFDTYKLWYVINFGAASLPKDILLPKNLKALLDYDNESNSDFYNTLKVYFKNDRNISDTVKELFVHRTTFNYRLQKIKEIMNTDFTDCDERLYMAIMFKLF